MSGICDGRLFTYTTGGSGRGQSCTPSRSSDLERGMEERTPALLVLNSYEARTAAAIFERLFPADEHGPGATELGVLNYLDRALGGAYQDKADTYRLGLAALDYAARRRSGMPFAECSAEQQDVLLTE